MYVSLTEALKLDWYMRSWAKRLSLSRRRVTGRYSREGWLLRAGCMLRIRRRRDGDHFRLDLARLSREWPIPADGFLFVFGLGAALSRLLLRSVEPTDLDSVGLGA